MPKTALKKVLTVSNVQNQTVDRIPLTGKWYQAFGRPQSRGVWCVWGGSGSGKSTFLMMLAKQMARHFETFYNPLEEGTDDGDFIERTQRLAMGDVEDTFYAQVYNYDEIMAYLTRRGSSKVLFIDSLRYLTMNWQEYYKMATLARKKDKIVVCSAFAKAGEPRSEFEYRVKHDANQKIYVDGYAAYCKGRTIGPNGGQFIIYEDGYNKIHGNEAAMELNNEL